MCWDSFASSLHAQGRLHKVYLIVKPTSKGVTFTVAIEPGIMNWVKDSKFKPATTATKVRREGGVGLDGVEFLCQRLQKWI